MAETALPADPPDAAACRALQDAVDADRVSLSSQLDPAARRRLGQFMTPAAVARFMASLFDHDRASVRLLEAGAGMGSLLAAYVDAACAAPPRPGRSLHVTAVELEPVLARRLRITLNDCAARCEAVGIAFGSTLVEQDFIDHAVAVATHNGTIDEHRLAQFDAAILNPPYSKIRVDSPHRRRLRQLGIESTNLYSAFVAVAIRMLRPDGELVAITPRSFCNGPYFRPFRQALVSQMSLRRLHIYESRDEAFSDDRVLQENVILHAIRNTSPPATVRLTRSDSATHADLSVRDVPYSQVVRPHDPDAFIHIAACDSDDAATEKVLR
ncbi:MAG TPA: Eco57I restriction-modification methylase domain-containing protein, partial [Povalibacter sp.]|nr:Eco57I restriction-modification methylase domain-containing protein [Povalibacter sp.]